MWKKIIIRLDEKIKKISFIRQILLVHLLILLSVVLKIYDCFQKTGNTTCCEMRMYLLSHLQVLFKSSSLTTVIQKTMIKKVQTDLFPTFLLCICCSQFWVPADLDAKLFTIDISMFRIYVFDRIFLGGSSKHLKNY